MALFPIEEIDAKDSNSTEESKITKYMRNLYNDTLTFNP